LESGALSWLRPRRLKLM